MKDIMSLIGFVVVLYFLVPVLWTFFVGAEEILKKSEAQESKKDKTFFWLLFFLVIVGQPFLFVYGAYQSENSTAIALATLGLIGALMLYLKK